MLLTIHGYLLFDTGAAPFESMQVADIGDVKVNLYDLKNCCVMISEQYSQIIANGCIPLTLGGDHTITYPILQAIAVSMQLRKPQYKTMLLGYLSCSDALVIPSNAKVYCC